MRRWPTTATCGRRSSAIGRGWASYQPEQLPELTEALLVHGWSEADVRGVLGENLLRVAGEVWPKAAG